ncbi:MAG: hypothetical protein CMJ32_07015 [Phycisphaerae bacterium]|nr:hypothetical protein [Phycisphaerae bacterium]
MTQILNLLSLVSRRCRINQFLNGCAWSFLGLTVIVLIWAAISKTTPSIAMPWVWVVCIGLGLVLAIGILALALSRPDSTAIALAIDQRLGLKERLSTALACRNRTDSFALAAIEDAISTASDPMIRKRARRKFPIGPPPGWWSGPALVLAVLIVWYAVPQGDLFSAEEPVDGQQMVMAKNQSQESIDVLVDQIQQNEELANSLSSELGELGDSAFDKDQFKTPEQVRREAIRQVTSLNQKLDEILNSQEAKTDAALRDSLSSLTMPEDGPGKDLADAMKQGDFKKALEALKDLQDKIAEGELTEQQKQAASKQLEQLAKQLEDLSQQKKTLEEQLQRAGMDPELANNPQALQQALQNNQNINQQQKQALQQMAQAQQSASQMCQSMSQACQSMAQQMTSGQEGSQSSGSQQMQQMLSDAEMMQQMLQHAQAMQSQCQSQCNGLGQAMSNKNGNGKGQGMGNRGQGAGGDAPIAPTPVGTRMVKETVKVEGGDIIARQYIDGEVVVGESRVKMQELSSQLGDGFENGVIDDPVPTHLKDIHKRYFGELKKKVDKALDKPAAPAKSTDDVGGSSSDSSSDSPG